MNEFKVLDGLPPYGPSAIPFSATGLGKHREGLVVEFFSGDEPSWTGNFQRGLTGYDTVFSHPDGQHIIVVSGGQAYVIDPDSQRLEKCFGAQIEYAELARDLDAIVFGNGLWFETVFPSGTIATKRLSWDGMQEIKRDGQHLTGKAYDPMLDEWVAFSVDLLEGIVTGGSYNLE